MSNVAALEIKIVSDAVVLANRRLRDLEKASLASETASGRLKQEVARLNAELAATKGMTVNAVASTRTLGSSLSSLAIRYMGVYAAIRAVKSVVETIREFDRLSAGLETSTGSAIKAEAAFGALVQFAIDTPSSLQQVTSAFTKLTQAGLDPSQRALTAYGDIAAAWGKDITQMTDAVTSAYMNQFRRLKEFGVLASVQGTNIRMSFHGVTTVVKKNSDEIQKYLIKLGETEFAGAMERRMKTLDGALSNTGDAWDKFIRSIAQSGAESGMTKGVLLVQDALNALTEMFESGRVEGALEQLGIGFTGWGDGVMTTLGLVGSAWDAGMDLILGKGNETVDALNGSWAGLFMRISQGINSWTEKRVRETDTQLQADLYARKRDQLLRDKEKDKEALSAGWTGKNLWTPEEEAAWDKKLKALDTEYKYTQMSLAQRKERDLAELNGEQESAKRALKEAQTRSVQTRKEYEDKKAAAVAYTATEKAEIATRKKAMEEAAEKVKTTTGQAQKDAIKALGEQTIAHRQAQEALSKKLDSTERRKENKRVDDAVISAENELAQATEAAMKTRGDAYEKAAVRVGKASEALIAAQKKQKESLDAPGSDILARMTKHNEFKPPPKTGRTKIDPDIAAYKRARDQVIDGEDKIEEKFAERARLFRKMAKASGDDEEELLQQNIIRFTEEEAARQKKNSAGIEELRAYLATEEEELAKSHRKRMDILMLDKSMGSGVDRRKLEDDLKKKDERELQLVKNKNADIKASLIAATQTESQILEEAQRKRMRDILTNAEFEKMSAKEKAAFLSDITRQSLRERTEMTNAKIDRRDSLMSDTRSEEDNLIAEEEKKRRAILASLDITEQEKTALLEKWESYRLMRIRMLNADQAGLIVGNAETLFANLAQAYKRDGKEQSATFQALYKMSKGFAVAQATISMYSGMAQAMALPWPANLAAYVGVAAKGAEILAMLNSSQYSGAYDKGGYIPTGKTGIVGEYGPEFVSGPANVTGRKKSEQIMRDAASQDRQPAQQASSMRIINVTDPAQAAGYLGSSRGEKVVMNHLNRNQNTIRMYGRM